MKTSFNRTCAVALAFGALGSAPAIAYEGLMEVSRQAEPAVNVVAEGREQLDRALTAYYRGEYGEAFRLLRNVSVLGDPEAHYRLGLMYAEGLGTRKNLNLAAHWLKLAAQKNHPGAAKALAALRPAEA